MAIQFATMRNIELKATSKGTKLGTDIHLEVGGGDGGMGTLVTVRVWTPLSPETTPLTELQSALAQTVHRVLQEAAAATPDDLRGLLMQSVTETE